MREHLKAAYQWQSGLKGGRPKKSPGSAISVARELWAKVTIEPVYYQTFHQSNFLRYFQVNPLAPAASSSSPLPHLSSAPRPMTVRERVEQQLAQKLQARDKAAALAGLQAQNATEVSPWLETTRWGDYFAGKSLRAAAHLIDLPTERRVIVAADTNSTSGLSYNVIEERQLALLLISFDRLIEQARKSLAEEKINIFDQHKVNSFLRRRTHQRPLLAKLKSGTYKSYQGVFKRLICFVYRMIHLGEQPALHCVLTNEQSRALDQMLHIVQLLDRVQAREKGELEFFRLRDLDSNQSEEAEAITKEEENDISLDALYQSLDQACLQFCITLLDHCLIGKIYDSIVLGFIAVLGINEGRDGFHDACNFTSKLSAFIKMAQLLVLQRAVVAAECGETQFPSEALDEMQDRFMVLESRSPMNWALKLRAYGKKIRESITCLGSLIWSVDREKLSLEFSPGPKEYGPSRADAQSAHGSLRAGLAYARALEEAPGHVEAARAEYRALSQEWHSFLGFSAYLGRRDRQVMVSPSTGAPILQPLHVRKRSYSTVEEGYNKGNESVSLRPLDIEAEIQRRVKEELLRIHSLDLPQAKRLKTKRVKRCQEECRVAAAREATSRGRFFYILCEAEVSEQDGYNLSRSEQYDLSARRVGCTDMRLSSKRHEICYSCYDDCLDAPPYRFADRHVGGPRDPHKLARKRLDIGVLRVCRQLYVEANQVLWRTTTWSFTHALAFSQFMDRRNALQRRIMRKLHLDLDPRYCWVMKNWADGWYAALHKRVLSKFTSLQVLYLDIRDNQYGPRHADIIGQPVHYWWPNVVMDELFPFPPPISKPIIALGPPETDGLRCTKEVDGEQCPYVCRTERGIREHSWEEHQWKSDEKGGRPPFFQETSQVTVFRSSTHPNRTITHPPNYVPEEPIKETDEAKEPNPWLRRVGCVGHLASVDRKQVRTFVAPVNPEKEPGLAILDTVFEWLIQDAQYHAVRDVVGFWIDITIIERYIEVWKQLLLFVFCAEEVNIDERPLYVLTEEQQTAIQVVRDRIDGFQQWKEEQDSAEEDPEDEGLGDDGSVEEDREEDREEEEDKGFKDGISDEEVRRIREIQREILRFCITLLDHPL
ncbi:hypothetical protein G7Y89_g978 [Cudoniella acicularis]|uniref:Uncharacterized protein n=1 Tax=Cudoniella acicularis TaxID=354080 RepID=A0A8H4W8D9_9HELO|nr:hypothetical protein G7Y89_g978 [Cudoniella acicularis]